MTSLIDIKNAFSGQGSPAVPAQGAAAPAIDFGVLVDFNYDPYASRRKVDFNEDESIILIASTKTGRGQGMPGPITIPKEMVDLVEECICEAGEAVFGKAELIEGRLVARVIFASALWTDCQGHWYDYSTFAPTDQCGQPIAIAA